MKVLVLGRCGFIGSHLVDGLVENGHDVRTLDDLEYQVHSGKVLAYIDTGTEYIYG